MFHAGHGDPVRSHSPARRNTAPACPSARIRSCSWSSASAHAGAMRRQSRLQSDQQGCYLEAHVYEDNRISHRHEQRSSFAVRNLPCSAVVLQGASISFNRDIRPIMSDTCFRCHGPDKSSRMANLRLDIREEALKPMKDGAIPIVPGDPDKSAHRAARLRHLRGQTHAAAVRAQGSDRKAEADHSPVGRRRRGVRRTLGLSGH